MNLTVCLIILGVIIVFGFIEVVHRLNFIIDSLSEIYKVLNPKEAAEMDMLKRLKEEANKIEAKALLQILEEYEANRKRP